MSVLRAFRKTSTMQFVANAITLNKELVRFVLKLSNKYSKVMETELLSNATRLIDDVLMANAVRVVNKKTFEERSRIFEHAKHVVHMLSVQVGIILDLTLPNDPNDKLSSVEKLCLSIGEKLTEELNLIDGVMAYDKKKYAEYKSKESNID